MSSLLSKIFPFMKTKKRASKDSLEISSVQDISSLLRKVKRIEIVSNRIANDVFSGHYKSAFRGQGIEFDEVREYQDGDDVRTIDWNVTARTGKPYVKRFSEERERSLLFMLDVSASNLFGSKASRLDTSIEIIASLMFSAIKNNDKIGLLTFANGVRAYYPPKKGKNYALRLIKEMLSVTPALEETDLNSALEFVDKTLKRRAVIFILSDFYVPQLEHPLLYCRHRHDLIAISISEPFEETFPNTGFIRLRDPETGKEVVLDAGSKKIRQAISERLVAKRSALAARLKEARLEPLFIENGGDYVSVLREFFLSRSRR
jgi:uncharacterized protein (DUF58 family)